jgi:1-acyl-sn-glycerol-3-phosphate acyltransferase
MRSWYSCCRMIIRLGGRLIWDLRCAGLANVPRAGGALLASNHQSLLDPPFVGSCLPREVHYMARRSLFRNPLFGALISRCNAFPVDRESGDLKAIRESISRLRAGGLLLVFPEGTRTRDGAIGPMKAGIGMLAERAGVPVVPVLIEGAYEVWPKGARLPRGGRVRVVFGRPFRMDSGDDAGDRIRNAVVALKGESAPCRTASS